MVKFRADFLRRRAEAFLEVARVDYERGYYDLVLFHVEQFLQLYLKYLLYRKVGDFPRTHSLTRLFKDVMEVYGDDTLRSFYSDNLEILYLLEEAYIASRYLPREYDEEIARRVLRFAERVREVLGCLERTPS